MSAANRAADDQLDGLLLGVAQNTKGIDEMLDVFFGFLRRKSDFFTGQPSNVIKETVERALERQYEVIEKEQKKQEEKQKRKQRETEAKQTQEPTAISKAKSNTEQISAVEVTSSSAAANESAGTESKSSDDVNDNPALHGNGGKGNGYWWTQTLSEVNVFCPIPRGIKGKQIDCEIKKDHLKFGIKGEKPVIDASLHKEVKPDDCYWTIEDSSECSEGRVLAVYLQKENGMEWWKSVAQGEPEIDTTKVEPENSNLNDLDPETRKTVEKMMYDQRMKAAGKPTSDEQQKQEMLQKFMKEHPEMDFSNAKIS